MADDPEYRCPHCNEVLDTVTRVQQVPVRKAFPSGSPFTGGVPAVMERFSTGERNARRWLAEARNGGTGD